MDDKCTFEFPSRWPQLMPLLVADSPNIREAIQLLDARDRALEDHLDRRPCGGACACWIGFYEATGTFVTAHHNTTTTVPFTLISSIGSLPASGMVRLDASLSYDILGNCTTQLSSGIDSARDGRGPMTAYVRGVNLAILSDTPGTFTVTVRQDSGADMDIQVNVRETAICGCEQGFA